LLTEVYREVEKCKALLTEVYREVQKCKALLTEVYVGVQQCKALLTEVYKDAITHIFFLQGTQTQHYQNWL